MRRRQAAVRRKDSLATRTAELESLGFSYSIDYAVKRQTSGVASGFGRVLINHEHRCYAEVSQVTMGNATLTDIVLRCRYYTLMTSTDDSVF